MMPTNAHMNKWFTIGYTLKNQKLHLHAEYQRKKKN